MVSWNSMKLLYWCRNVDRHARGIAKALSSAAVYLLPSGLIICSLGLPSLNPLKFVTPAALYRMTSPSQVKFISEIIMPLPRVLPVHAMESLLNLDPELTLIYNYECNLTTPILYSCFCQGFTQMSINLLSSSTQI
jgi:hypothetical protein